jgi:hypothetical protein
MSMIGNYLRLPQADLDAVLAKPESIGDFLYPEDDSQYPHDRHLDIDKAWHLIHFLLTGTEWEGAEPLRSAVLGGDEIGDEDVGYGPARAMMPAKVSEVSQALDGISAETLWKRFDLEMVEDLEIYPGWTGSAQERSYVLSHYEKLREFFNTTAADHAAMILYLS